MLLLPLLLACAPEPAPTPEGAPAAEAAPSPAAEPDAPAEPALILLISLDTTRADALGCYGGEGAITPSLDGLAARGVRFESALAQAPTTLASHAALFTGRDGHGTGVVRNGTPPDPTLPLLAERLAGGGWDTAAVIGASVLDERAGLARGFRLYDDDVGDEKVRRRYEDEAPDVTRRALAAADARQPGRPLFLFVHYFDAHMPWTSAPAELVARFVDPLRRRLKPNSAQVRQLIALGRRNALPEAHRREARALYLAEVAWVDQAVGGLLAGLEERGMLQQSLVVAFSDHGESLGEPSSLEVFGHGLDVDPPNLHVPLIFAGSGRLATPRGAVVARPVRLMDVGATLLAQAGLDPRLGEAEDLGALWREGARPGPAPASFAEASKPIAKERKDAWNNLPFERSVAADGHLLVRTPWRSDERRLYRIAPGWPEIADETVEAALIERLNTWDAAAPAHRDPTVDASTRDMLEALGYLEKER